MNQASRTRMGTRCKTNYSGRMEWLRVADITVDPRAQREFRLVKAVQIARDFDPDLLGKPAVVALVGPNGRERYIVVDGQHRIAAVKMALGEDQLIECEVIRGVDVARAARLFCGRNAMTLPTALDLFLASVTHKDKAALAIKSIVEQHGLRIESRASKDGNIPCVGTLLKLYRLDNGRSEKGRPCVLDATLALAIAAWGATADAVNGAILHGLGLVLLQHGDQIDRTALTRKLASLPGGALGLLGRARSYRNAAGGPLAHNVSRAAVALYNSGRRVRPLPEWSAQPDQPPSGPEPLTLTS